MRDHLPLLRRCHRIAVSPPLLRGRAEAEPIPRAGAVAARRVSPLLRLQRLLRRSLGATAPAAALQTATVAVAAARATVLVAAPEGHDGRREQAAALAGPSGIALTAGADQDGGAARIRAGRKPTRTPILMWRTHPEAIAPARPVAIAPARPLMSLTANKYPRPSTSGPNTQLAR